MNYADGRQVGLRGGGGCSRQQSMSVGAKLEFQGKFPNGDTIRAQLPAGHKGSNTDKQEGQRLAQDKPSIHLVTMYSYLFVLEKLHLIVIDANNGIYINPTNCTLSQPYLRTPDTNLPEQNTGEI